MLTNATWVRKNPKKIIAIFLLLIFISLDLFLTVGVRLVRKGTTAKRPNENPMKLRVQHPIYHHGFKPNTFSDQERWGDPTYTYFSNSLGFRDQKIRKISASPDTHRIVFMGDSFTEGQGINFEDTYVGIVSEQLASKKVEILNGGVASYSPSIYYIKTL